MAKKRRSATYKNPPLVEVFCEFFFEGCEGVEWDSFLVPQFYDKIKATFPSKKQISSLGIELKMSKRAKGVQVRQHGPPTPRTQFVSQDGKTVIQLGENLLVVNQMPGYYGWENFEPVIRGAFGNYLEFWSPKQIGRLALHYIDKIVVPKVQYDLSEYFNMYPVLPTREEHTITNMAMAFEIEGATERDVLAVAFQQHPAATPDSTAFLLAFDYLATQALPATVETVREWLVTAHEFTASCFDDVLTDTCKELFK